MNLIKLTNDHYVIVDDSEIKEGDWYIDDTNRIRQAVMGDGLYWAVRNGYKKITHSTNIDWNEVYYIPLSEVKELIGEVDVFTVVEQWSKSKEKFVYQYWNKPSFIEGYNQALEDNKDKKYTEEDMKECIKSILRDLNAHNEIDKPVNFVWTDSFKKHIQSLKPKTEWEVEFNTNGKLKLK